MDFYFNFLAKISLSLFLSLSICLSMSLSISVYPYRHFWTKTCFITSTIKQRVWAVVVVKWSACSPSTPWIRVQIPLMPTIFFQDLYLKRPKINEKSSGLVIIISLSLSLFLSVFMSVFPFVSFPLY